MALLDVEDLYAGYTESNVLHGVSLEVEAGGIVSLLGANGAGKTTTLRAIAGLLEPRDGRIQFDGADLIGRRPHEINRLGITLVPEDRGVFPDLTVDENLRVPLGDETGWSHHEIYEKFPPLREVRHSKGKHLSGGEQQLLAIGRALRGAPQLLLLDEPTEGLAPQAMEWVIQVFIELTETTTAILFVEQNLEFALDVAEYSYVMDGGEIVVSGSSSTIREMEDTVRRYLGFREGY